MFLGIFVIVLDAQRGHQGRDGRGWGGSGGREACNARQESQEEQNFGRLVTAYNGHLVTEWVTEQIVRGGGMPTGGRQHRNGFK